MINVTSDGDDMSMNDDAVIDSASDRHNKMMQMYDTQNMRNMQRATEKVTGQNVTEQSVKNLVQNRKFTEMLNQMANKNIK